MTTNRRDSRAFFLNFAYSCGMPVWNRAAFSIDYAARNHDDCMKMPLLTINHKTVYRYTRPVAFGEHRIMLLPRDSHDLRVLKSDLVIDPQPMSLRWIHDVFGNSVAIATFDERADTLSFVSTATVEHNPA